MYCTGTCTYSFSRSGPNTRDEDRLAGPHDVVNMFTCLLSTCSDLRDSPTTRRAHADAGDAGWLASMKRIPPGAPFHIYATAEKERLRTGRRQEAAPPSQGLPDGGKRQARDRALSPASLLPWPNLTFASSPLPPVSLFPRVALAQPDLPLATRARCPLPSAVPHTLRSGEREKGRRTQRHGDRQRVRTATEVTN